MLRILRIGIFFLLLSNCGYVPIYSNQSDANLNIKITSLEGEKDINISLAQKLSRYQNENAEIIFDVKVISEYEKNSLIKDEAGNTTNFRLSLKVEFLVSVNGSLKKMKFEEKFDIRKDDKLFEESNYEKVIKKDMINLIIQKFTSQLLLIQ